MHMYCDKRYTHFKTSFSMNVITLNYFLLIVNYSSLKPSNYLLHQTHVLEFNFQLHFKYELNQKVPIFELERIGSVTTNFVFNKQNGICFTLDEF